MGRPSSPARRRYRCRDGYLRLEVQSAQQWQALAKCLGRPELAYPGSWEVAASAPPRGRLGRLLESLFRQEPVATWLRRLEAHGVPCRPD